MIGDIYMIVETGDLILIETLASSEEIIWLGEKNKEL